MIVMVNWSVFNPFEAVLWQTCQIIGVNRLGWPGRIELPSLGCMFPLLKEENLVAVEQARVRWLKSKAPQPYERATYRDAIGISSVNDIKYAQFGLAMTDEMSKYYARKDKDLGVGRLTVTNGRVHFERPRLPDLIVWFSNIEGIDLTGEGVVEIVTRKDDGSRLVLEYHTPWASYIFGMTTVAYFKRHPRLLSGQWLPPGFEEHCERLGEPCAPARRLAMNL
ncbi:hypothetical protein ACFSKW_49950 [Nonomuraea mangrovi]|uniref:Uncharacterized protein n=2 Tax=Nonomuraea TaxID=83681 RepID=A0ABW4TF33_9ACTN